MLFRSYQEPCEWIASRAATELISIHDRTSKESLVSDPASIRNELDQTESYYGTSSNGLTGLSWFWSSAALDVKGEIDTKKDWKCERRDK